MGKDGILIRVDGTFIGVVVYRRVVCLVAKTTSLSKEGGGTTNLDPTMAGCG